MKGFSRLPIPKKIIQTIEFCNLKCDFCPNHYIIWDRVENKKKGIPYNLMTVENYTKIVKNLSKLNYENQKLAYELSSNNLQLLKEEYARTRNELSIQVTQALNNYRSSAYSSEEFTIHSKINGTVYALYKQPGEIVNTIEPLALIGSTNNFVIELMVDEMDIVKLEIGQKTLLTLDVGGVRQCAAARWTALI